MSEEERLQLENELLMTCSKSQAINKYIDEVEENRQLKEVIEEVRKYIDKEMFDYHETPELLQIFDKAGDINEKKN